MTRILFLGDLDTTGFGSVTTDLGRALLERGEDVRFVSQNAFEGALPEPFRSRTVSATSLVTVVDQLTGQAGTIGPGTVIAGLLDGSSDSNLVSGEPWGGWVPEAAILLGDFTAARMFIMPTPDLWRRLEGRLFHYVPIEGVDLPPLLGRDLWRYTVPVAMSQFGAEEISRVTGVRPEVVYHGVDCDVFHPATPEAPIVIDPPNAETLTLSSREDCRSLWEAYFVAGTGMKLPRHEKAKHGKWILRTDRHMPRKGYNAMLKALVPVLYRQADAVMILHCRQFDQGGYLPDTLSKLPGARALTPGSEESKPDGWALFGREYPQVLFTNLSGMERNLLASLYNAADLYLSTSAEGFGLTIAEALACGTPALGAAYSAVPEVIGEGGGLIDVAHLVENPYDHYWCAVDPRDVETKVEHLLTHRTQREERGRKGMRHVRDTFRWSTAAEQFSGLITAAVTKEAVA